MPTQLDLLGGHGILRQSDLASLQAGKLRVFNRESLIERLIEIKQYGREKISFGMHVPRNGDTTDAWAARVRIWERDLAHFLAIVDEELSILLKGGTRI